jgi:hypothetical protein
VNGLWLSLALAASLSAAPPAGKPSPTESKLALIENDQARPGSRIQFGQAELNTYIRDKIPEVVPQGVRNPRVEIAAGKASGHALIDFSKLGRPAGDSMLWKLLGKLIEGERPVSVTAAVTSANGTATVDLQQVTISGNTIEGRPLKLLVDTFFLPLYPDAKIGEPFALRHNVESIELVPGSAQVRLRP